MKIAHVTRMAVFYEPRRGHRLKVGRLATKARQLLFEYDPAFLATRLELSPFKLPLSPGVVVGDPAVLDGLMGVFDDSLPDGWGRLLIDRRAAGLGLSASALTPLDRLALVGARSMGALTYEPETVLEEPGAIDLSALAEEVKTVLADRKPRDLEALIAAGGSPKGARPKVLVQLGPKGEVLLGARDIRPKHTAWLVKFPSPNDDPNVAPLEHAYFLMARAAGVAVPRTQLLGATKRHRGYFAIERFDRVGSSRVHMHTLGGLLHLPPGYPALDYRDLLRVTRELTRDESAVREMFRRACFNVFAHNRDDHSRNFAFLMTEQGEWSPSPAYDLLFTDGPGGEHTLLVAGEGRAPGLKHLTTLAAELELKNATRVVDEVRAAVSKFSRYADKAGVPARLRARVAKTLDGIMAQRVTRRR